MTIKNFKTAAKKRAVKTKGKGAAAAPDIEFKVNDEGGYFLRGEIDEDVVGAVAMEFMSLDLQQGADTPEARQATAEATQAFADMLKALFTPATKTALLGKVKAKEMELADLAELVEWAVEQHSGGRPTTSQRT